MATRPAVLETEEWVPAIGFGDRLRVVRRKKHRTQGEMAELLGVKQVTYASWEAGAATPSYEDVVRIARRLQILDRVPQWWTLGAGEPTDSLSIAGTRSSTDRASDYGSQIGRTRVPLRGPRRRIADLPGRHLTLVPPIYAASA